MQTSLKPVCCDLRSQIKFLQREFLILQNEYFSKPVPVQIRMKRYCFKRGDNGEIYPKPLNPCIDSEKVDSDSLHDPDEPNLVHSLHDPNLMQPDQLHIGDEPNLVRYFEKLVRDEVWLQLCA